MANATYKIFIVDDDPLYLEMLNDFLSENPKFDIKQFETGEGCLDNLGDNPDVIVLDYFLDNKDPEAKDGLEVLRSIKEALPKVDVIMLSSQDDFEVVYKLVKEGANGYVIKDKNAFDDIKKILDEVIAEKEVA